MINFLVLNAGIILNLIGTIMIALSFGSYPNKSGAPYTTDIKGKGKKYIAYFNYPGLFLAGLVFLGIGFCLQLKF